MVIIVVAHFDWKHSSKTLFHIGAVAPHPWYESPTPSHPQGAFIELGSGDCGDHLNSSHSSIVSPISDLAFCVMITDQVLEWSIPSSQHATTNNQCWWRDCQCNILPFLVRQPLRSPVVCLLAHRPVVVGLRTNKIRWDVGIDVMTPFLSSTKNKPHTHTHIHSHRKSHMPSPFLSLPNTKRADEECGYETRVQVSICLISSDSQPEPLSSYWSASSCDYEAVIPTLSSQ